MASHEDIPLHPEQRRIYLALAERLLPPLQLALRIEEVTHDEPVRAVFNHRSSPDRARIKVEGHTIEGTQAYDPISLVVSSFHSPSPLYYIQTRKAYRLGQEESDEDLFCKSICLFNPDDIRLTEGLIKSGQGSYNDDQRKFLLDAIEGTETEIEEPFTRVHFLEAVAVLKQLKPGTQQPEQYGKLV